MKPILWEITKIYRRHIFLRIMGRVHILYYNSHAELGFWLVAQRHDFERSHIAEEWLTLFPCKAISNTLINWTGQKEKEKKNRYTIISDTKDIKMEDIENSLSGNEINSLQNGFDLCMLGLINLSNILLCKVYIRKKRYLWVYKSTNIV